MHSDGTICSSDGQRGPRVAFGERATLTWGTATSSSGWSVHFQTGTSGTSPVGSYGFEEAISWESL